MKKNMEINEDELSLRAFWQKRGFQNISINDESRLLPMDAFTRKRLLCQCQGKHFIIPLCRGTSYSFLYTVMPLLL